MQDFGGEEVVKIARFIGFVRRGRVERSLKGVWGLEIYPLLIKCWWPNKGGESSLNQTLSWFMFYKPSISLMLIIFMLILGITSLIHGRVLFGIMSFLRWGRGGRLEMTKTLRVFKDPWLPRPSSFKPNTRPSRGSEDLLVADLLATTGWDREVLEDLFWLIDRDVMWSIPLSSRS